MHNSSCSGYNPFPSPPKLVDDVRPYGPARLMMVAELESMWSTCQRLRVGTVVVDERGKIRLTARNGSPSGIKHCNRQPVQDGRCTYCIHAETNCINSAAAHGIRTRDLDMFTLYRPCVSCANNIIEAGFASVYYRHNYDTDRMFVYVMDLFLNSNVHFEQLVMTPEEITFSKMLESWRNTWTTQ